MNPLKVSEDEFLFISEDGIRRLNTIWESAEPAKHIHWTTDYTVELPVRVKKSGSGSETPFTLVEGFQKTLTRFPKNEAMRVTRNKKVLTWTFEQYYQECCYFGKALIALNITPYRSVNIIGFNAPEWSITFYGSIFGNYLPVGIYTTNGPEACHYVASHSEAEVVVVENQEHLRKFLAIWQDLPLLKYVVVYNDKLPENIPAQYKSKVLLWNDFLEIGKKHDSNDPNHLLEARMKKQKPGNCCTLVYTSGTTGMPKGVMISHDNYTWTATYFLTNYKISYGTERVVSYLPLSHVAAQIIDIISTMLAGMTVTFADHNALQGSLVETLKEVRPTFFFSVPRVWEKMEEKMKIMAASNGAVKSAIANWAKGMGVEGTYAEINVKAPPFCFSTAKKLVYNNVKKALGLDQAKHLMFGAAPMQVSTRQYFLSLNMYLINGYGMSECAGPQTFSDPTNYPDFSNDSLASCGSKMKGTDLIIHDADKDGNGEICFKGRNRFMGYYKNEESTKATIDNNGFLHSGDVGKLDKRGNLSITGRLKELIITAGGENIAPILIENEVKEELKFISNAMVIGDKRKYLVLILTLKHELDKAGKLTEKLSEEAMIHVTKLGSKATTVKEAMKDEKILKEVEEGIKKANNRAISRAHHIRKWAFIDGDFTVDTGELTPTMKLKRKVVEKQHEALIESLYQDPKL